MASTHHDKWASADFERLTSAGIYTAREGARWHVIETHPGRYDFSSLERIFDAAQQFEVEIILDLLHFGWPDSLDVFRSDFIQAFREFTEATVQFLRSRQLGRHLVLPVNEISFQAWAGGDAGLISPHMRAMGGLLKRQLVKASIAASQIIREKLPHSLLLSAEPLIHIVGRPDVPGDEIAAHRHRAGMFEAWDMITGRTCPELGGKPEYLDIIGLNFYDRNQWMNQGETVKRDNPRYRPLHDMLAELYRRYNLPLMISETGTENDERAPWFAYVCAEVQTALAMGVPVEGICLYPIVNHPGWDDDRHCHNGLWDYAAAMDGQRSIYEPLAAAIAFEQARFGGSDETFERVA